MATTEQQTTEYDMSGLVKNEELHPTRHPPSMSDISSVSVGQVNPAFTNEHDTSMQSSNVTVVSYASQLGVRSNTPVVLTRPDGSKIIITPNRDHRDQSILEPPLKERKILILKILSVVSILLFLPTGIAAVVYAWKADKEFHKGGQRNDTDSARRTAKICERLLIFSLVIGLVMWVMIIALIERVSLTERDHDRGLTGV